MEVSKVNPPTEIRFSDSVSGEMLFTIKADGMIVKGPAFTTDDDASLKFWEVLDKTFPKFLQKFTSGLTPT